VKLVPTSVKTSMCLFRTKREDYSVIGASTSPMSSICQTEPKLAYQPISTALKACTRISLFNVSYFCLIYCRATSSSFMLWYFIICRQLCRVCFYEEVDPKYDKNECMNLKTTIFLGLLEEGDEEYKGQSLFAHEFNKMSSYYTNKSFVPEYRSSPQDFVPANRYVQGYTVTRLFFETPRYQHTQNGSNEMRPCGV